MTIYERLQAFSTTDWLSVLTVAMRLHDIKSVEVSDESVASLGESSQTIAIKQLDSGGFVFILMSPAEVQSLEDAGEVQEHIYDNPPVSH